MASKDKFDAANKRAVARLRRCPRAITAQYEHKRDRVVIELSTGIEVAFRPRDAQGLERAKPDQLGKIEISPLGFSIHFPKLDANIYLPALLEVFLGKMKSKLSVNRPFYSAPRACSNRLRGLRNY